MSRPVPLFSYISLKDYSIKNNFLAIIPRMISRFGSIFNFILTAAIAYILIFVWIRFYVSPLWKAALISLAITAAVISVLRLLTSRRRTRKAVGFKEKARKNKIFGYMTYCTAEENMAFLDKLYPKADGTVIFCVIKQNKLTPDEVIELYLQAKSRKPAKILVLCAEYTPQAAAAAVKAPDTDMSLLNADDIYLKMKEADYFPQVPESAVKKPKRLPVLLSAAFNRKKIKGYLFSAVALVFASLFIPYSLYYRIFASILLGAALICCFNINWHKKSQNQQISHK